MLVPGTVRQQTAAGADSEFLLSWCSLAQPTTQLIFLQAVINIIDWLQSRFTCVDRCPGLLVEKSQIIRNVNVQAKCMLKLPARAATFGRAKCGPAGKKSNQMGFKRNHVLLKPTAGTRTRNSRSEGWGDIHFTTAGRR